MIIPIEEGNLNQGEIVGALGGVMEAGVPGRSSKDEITLFESVGLAFEDAAIARIAYDQARSNGQGVEVNL